MKIRKSIHSGWTEWNRFMSSDKVSKKSKNLIKKLSPDGWFGKYKYDYSHKRKVISLIELPSYYNRGQNVWECLEITQTGLIKNNDVRRFLSKEEAEKEIIKILTKK